MNNTKVNFEQELIQRGYSVEEIRDAEGKLHCTNYQKKIGDMKWNSISIFPGGVIWIAEPLRKIETPETMEEINEVLKSIGDEAPE